MSQEEFYKEISETIVSLEEEKAIDLANRAIKEKMNILDIIEKGYGEAIRKLGELWDSGEFFLPELMMGGKIVQNSIDVLLPHLEKGQERKSLGKVVVATIEGDIHSIGKTIVATMLNAYGFEVYDLGADVPAEKIIEKAIEVDANIIGVSALLTTTMLGQKRVVELLRQKGITKFKVILGGAPVTSTWVEECNADGYDENAIEAVKLVKTLLSIQK
jgi:corrinoid protein of di/trimethylamine methyltransferase